jgi:hypothetical protein
LSLTMKSLKSKGSTMQTVTKEQFLPFRGLIMSTYYDKELSNLGNIAATLKLHNEQGQTRWMTVTPEQIQQILEILNKSEVAA